MIDIDNYAQNLTLKDGIYLAKNRSEISYPEGGNDEYYKLEDHSFWFQHRNNCIITAVKKHAPNEVFFDIGGGNGYVSRGLQDHNIDTVLVEPGFQGCLNAQKRNVQNIICATLQDASFKKSSLNAVGLFDVVEHISEDLNFLKMISLYMSENGKIFITVPAYQALWSDEDDAAGHFRRYSTKEMEEKLTAAGFEIVQSTYIFSILPPFVYIFRTLANKLGLAKAENAEGKHQNEHKIRKGFFSNVLNKIWKTEIKHIKNGKKIPFGGSCFIIAQKK